MYNLKNLMIYFVKEFPQVLGRTQLIKAIYLFDVEWYEIFGNTYTGLQYKRDNNGPFDITFYEAKDQLINENILIERPYYHQNGIGYQIFIENDHIETTLHPLALSIADDILERLGNKGLNDFLKTAYETAPMKAVLNKESELGHFIYGEAIPMSELKKSPDPLFTLDEVKDALKKMDFNDRGSDEEYNEIVFSEFIQLSKTRERVKEACKQIGEK